MFIPEQKLQTSISDSIRVHPEGLEKSYGLARGSGSMFVIMRTPVNKNHLKKFVVPRVRNLPKEFNKYLSVLNLDVELVRSHFILRIWWSTVFKG